VSNHNATKTGKDYQSQPPIFRISCIGNEKSSGVARKSIGGNNVKFQVVLPAYIDEAVDELARLSDLSKAQYIRRVLRQAVQQQAVYATSVPLALGDKEAKQ
jgi:hypothetical protein